MLSALYLVTAFSELHQRLVGRKTSEENETTPQKKIKESPKVQQITKRKDNDQVSVTLESIFEEFHLENETLVQMMTDMNRRMDLGLEGGLDLSTVAMLPSFVPTLPDRKEKGKYLAMDLGGTNLRVLLMQLEPGEEPLTEQRNYRIPSTIMTGPGVVLFDFIVKSLGDFLEEKGLLDEELNLGFTFSYPCKQTSLRTATLLRWTKGFKASGVEGHDVVRLLEEAIHRYGGLKVRIAALMNDTVGTQVATAFEHGDCSLGVIVATGTNCSYMEEVSNIEQVDSSSYAYQQMIIDTEWGGFGDGEAAYVKTQYDHIVDDRSVHPGVQSFDKLVAGMYMGELVRLVIEKLVHADLMFAGEGSEVLFTPGTFHTKFISEILGDESGCYTHTRQILDELAVDKYAFGDILLLREICIAISRRSANLAAAAIACAIKRVGKKKITVGIDGSTYRYHPFYHFWVTEKLHELLGPKIEFHLVQAGDGSGKGAALVAAIADRLNIV